MYPADRPRPTADSRTTRTLLCLLCLALPAGAMASEIEDAFEQGVALEITRPGGRIYMDLLSQSDGPARIPLRKAATPALQISTSFLEDGRLRVVIHSVADEETIQLLATHDLAFPEAAWRANRLAMRGNLTAADLATLAEQLTEKVYLSELSSLGLEGWSMQLAVPALTRDNCACCSCGSSLYCCPNAGFCLGCGNCGDCCCTGGGAAKPPLHDN